MIALIPARGGSKGLPGKNIISFCGKPLISYTIEAALSAHSIDKVIVTTDDPEIAKVAKEYGAEVPFLRPKELAEDHSRAIDVYRYMAQRLKKDFKLPLNAFAVLLPTAPFRKASHIDAACKIFHKKNADSVISVSLFEPPIQWALQTTNLGTITPFLSKEKMKNRQEEDSFFCPNGAIYIFSTQYIMKHESYYGKNTYPYMMSNEESLDIDTPLDLKWGEFLMKQCALQGENKNEVR